MNNTWGKIKQKIRSTVLCILFGAFLYQPVSSSAIDEPLIMGVFPRKDATVTTQAFTPLANYLSEKLKRKVILETTYNFSSFWQGVKNKRYDIVHYNQYHYIRSHNEYGYNVIAMNEEYGKSTISSEIITKKDSGITSLQDLRNKTIAFGGGPKAMVSYILPVYILSHNGVSAYDYQSIFAQSPPNALMTMYYDKADAVGVGENIVNMIGVKNKVDPSGFITLAKSEEIAHLPWAVRNDMPLELSMALQKFITSLKNTSEGKHILEAARVSNFVTADDSSYNRTREIVLEVLGAQY